MTSSSYPATSSADDIEDRGTTGGDRMKMMRWMKMMFLSMKKQIDVPSQTSSSQMKRLPGCYLERYDDDEAERRRIMAMIRKEQYGIRNGWEMEYRKRMDWFDGQVNGTWISTHKRNARMKLNGLRNATTDIIHSFIAQWTTFHCLKH